MHLTLRHTAIVTTALIGLAAFSAVAAPATTDPAHPAAATSPRAAAGHHTAGGIEAHITDLHTRLGISPAQQSQWDDFAAVMRQNAQAMDATYQRRMQAMPTMTATENMQSYAEIAQDRASEMQKLVPAFQALYGTMSDGQKRVADQVFRDSAQKPHHG